MEPQNELGRVDGIIVLDSLFFLEKKLLKANTDVVKKTLSELYKYTSKN